MSAPDAPCAPLCCPPAGPTPVPLDEGEASARAVAQQSECGNGPASAAERRGNPPDSRSFSAADANEQLARLAKALGHPARVAIMRLLLRRSACVCGEIVDQLPLAQSTVSQHLKQLKEAGLIRGEVDGPRVCYCVDPGMVAVLKTLVAGL